jgi:hypothetical protein
VLAEPRSGLRTHAGRLAAPVVRLAGGATVRSTRVTLPGAEIWVAFLPDAGVRGLRSGRRSVPLDLPAPAARCGYSAERGF